MPIQVEAACEAIEKAWKLTQRIRGLCPSTNNPQSLVGQMGYRSGGWYRERSIDFIVRLPRPMTLDDAQNLNLMGTFVNTSFIITMAAILEGYEFTPYGDSVNKSKECWEFALLTKWLRNYFVHGEFKRTPTAEDIKKAKKTRPSVAELEKELSGEELVKEAEKESLGVDIEKKKKELLEKVAKLKGKIETVSAEELKEKVKGKKKGDMLVPLEEYVKSGIYLGTKVVTPQMKQYVYRRRADGLAIFNTDIIDEKMKEGIEYMSKFDAKDIILVCKRQAGWKTAEMFGKVTGIKVFTKKYPAGVLTNTTLPDFFENELSIVCDSWLDKNALNDTLNVHKKILMVCDTNNFPQGTNQIIIGNNKSARSLGLIFYLLARGFCKAKGIDTEGKMPDLEWWASEDEKGGAVLGV